MSSTDSPLRVAIAGAGLMGRWHAHAASRAGSTVVAVLDPDAAAAQALARATGARPFASLPALLAGARPQAVHVCTPLATHRALALEAIDAGAHVLVEKPLAPDVSQTREVLEAAAAAGVMAVPVHQFAFQPGVAEAAAAIRAGLQPLRIDFRICTAGGEGLEGEARDALVADILPHPFSVLQALFPGRPLLPDDWSARWPRPGEFHARGCSGGTEVTLYISLEARPPCNEADLYASGGGLHLDFFHGFAARRQGPASRLGKALQPFRAAGSNASAAATNLAMRAWRREPAYPGLAALVSRFHEAIRSGGAPPVSPSETLAVASLRDRLAAARTGQPPEAARP